jgi:hypothetical protein
MFSAPVFLVIWGLVYSLLKAGRNAGDTLKWVLITGVCMAVAAWGVFTGFFRHVDREIFRLIIVAPFSGAIAIFISYPGIKKACHTRDTNNTLSENGDAKKMAAH